MERGKFIRDLLLASVVAGGSAAIAGANAETVAQPAPIIINCDNKVDMYHPIAQGNNYLVKASGIVMSADASVDGVQQFDNDPNTSSVVAMKSNDNSNKIWDIYANYGGSIQILKCGDGFNDLYAAAGRTEAVVDL